MLISELKKGETYTNVVDPKVPLMFTGEVKKGLNVGYNTYVDRAYFKPVKTEINKNWFDPTIQGFNFDPEFGTSLIK